MPRVNSQADFYELPDIPSGYALPPSFSIIMPIGEDRENLVINPSFERSIDNWTAPSASIQRTTTRSFVGAYSLSVVPTTSNDGIYYGGTTPLSLTINQVYAVSFRFLNVIAGLQYDAYIASTGGTRISGSQFKSTGFWQCVTFLYTETSSASRRLYIVSNGNLSANREFFIDAVQVELTSSGKRYPTTYIDGDQRGFIITEFPLPYYWVGEPHESTSIRSRSTRTGGRVSKLQDLGLTISSVVGLSLPVPQIVSMPFGQLDGEQYQNTRKNPREFSIAGRITGRSAVLFEQGYSSVVSLLDRDSHSRDEPIVLVYTPLDEVGNQIGTDILIPCNYTGGLEGQRNNLNGEIFTASFRKSSPSLYGHSEGKFLVSGITVTNAVGILRRTVDGVWTSCSIGITAAGTPAVNTAVVHPDGTVYIGGDFQTAGLSSAEYAAKYNPVTDTFSSVKSNTAFNGIVHVIKVGPDGSVYFGGAFSNVDGIANADGIVKYNPVANTFSALGTGISGGAVFDISFDSSGNLYAAGSFSTMGGVVNTARIAKWDGTVWTPLSTGANNDINAVLVVGTNVYAAGLFTSIGGSSINRIARWNGSAWSAMGTGANSGVNALALGKDGHIYVGGNFTTLGGLSINYFGRWNGVSFSYIGASNAISSTVHYIEVAPDGTIYVSGTFGTVNGITLPDRIVKWDGSSFTPLDVDLPSSLVGMGSIPPSGELYAIYSSSGGTVAFAAAVTDVEHTGTSRTYPTIVLRNQQSSSRRVYQIANLTTNRYIYLNYTILPGEVATLRLMPSGLSFSSNFQGDISSLVQPGSWESDFYIVRGTNSISVLCSDDDVDIDIFWDQGFLTASDAVGKV